MSAFYTFTANRLDGQPQLLADYLGQVVLVVNTASACGFTPQYAGLQALYEKYRDQGFTVLGFPCNQFGHQEKEDEATIGAFCEKNYGVTFPLFAKIEVNGQGAHPLFQFLKTAQPGLLGTTAIKWNFTKFLINREGIVTQRFAPNDTPEAIAPAISALLL